MDRAVINTKLYEHQRLALALLRINNSYALFMEQGTGKTLPTLCHIAELLNNEKIKTAVIIAPKATMGAWHRDIELFNEPFRSLLQDHVDVINYDLVWRRKRYEQPFDLIVLDESHYIKNRQSKRSKFVLEMSLSAKYRYILTGTPIGNGQLENIWSQYAFLEPSVYRNRVSSVYFGTYYQFLNRYAALNQYYQPYRYFRVDEMQDIINEHSYRVTKEECLDLPDKLPDEIYDIELKEKKTYKELHKESVVMDLEMVTENPLARMVKLRQICSGFIKDDDGNLHEYKCEKPKALREFLDNYDKKLAIFCNFTYSIDQVCKVLDKLKIKYIVLDGRQKDKQIWTKFQNDKDIKVIVCQYQSANAGIDLYKADTILFYEPTLSSTILDQSRDRIHRIGQTSKCSYIHFITKGTIEVAIFNALKNYSDFNEKLFEEYIQFYQKGRY